MLWGCALFAGLLIGAADIWLFTEKRSPAACINAVFRDVIVTNLLTFSVMKYLLNVSNVFVPSMHGPKYALKYLALALVIGLIFLALMGFLKKFITVEPSKPKRKAGAWVMRIFATVMFALGLAAITGTVWGKQAFGDLSPDQIIINLNSPIEGTDVGVYISVLEGPVLITAVLTAVFCLLIFPSYKIVYNKNEKQYAFLPGLAIRIISLVLAAAILAGGLAFGITRFNLMDLYAAYVSGTSYIEDNYADPTEVKITFPEKKRNLIHIYLESMENTYFSKDLGGNMNENLMPDLAELAKEGISFSHTADTFGGPYPSTGSGWSVAGMVNMTTGLPMKVPVDGNSYGQKDNFLPGATALGDILYENGYEQTLMFGADATFGGLNFYFESHGKFNILDYNGVKEKGWIPEDYKVWWGYEDDKLYEFAQRELTRLAETGKPFNFVMETADTHAPDGYLSSKAEKRFDSQYANAIYYSQKEAVKFVRWIQEQPFYENTTIVMIGDHLSMASAFFENMDKSYQRTCFNLILNPADNVKNIDKSRTYNRQWAMFDMYPTILASMGVEISGDRLAIGTNLFSDTPTLVERDGIQKVNKELTNRSNFYNENILVDKKRLIKGKK